MRQCALRGVGRAGYYYEPSPETPANLALMRRLDEMRLEFPAYGSRRLKALLEREGPAVNRKRVQRLLQVMGVEGDLPQGGRERARGRSPHLPVPAAAFGNHGPGPGVVRGHHLRADEPRVPIFDGGDGLAEPACGGVGMVEHDGR